MRESEERVVLNAILPKPLARISRRHVELDRALIVSRDSISQKFYHEYFLFEAQFAYFGKGEGI